MDDTPIINASDRQAIEVGASFPATDSEWAATEDRLHRWAMRARNNAFGHQEAARYNSTANYFFGGGVIAITFLSQAYKTHTVLVALCTAAVTAFAALQTFLKSSEAASKHLAAATSYSTIRRKIERIDATPRRMRDSIPTVLKEIADALDAIDSAPPIPDKHWKRGVKKAEEQVAHPIFLSRAKAAEQTEVAPMQPMPPVSE